MKNSNPANNDKHSRKALVSAGALITALSVVLSGCGSAVSSASLASYSGKNQNFWELLTASSSDEETVTDSGSSEDPDKWKSGWYKLKKAGDQAEKTNEGQPEDKSSAEDTSVDSSEKPAEEWLSEEELEKALADAYAQGYEEGYAAGMNSDSSRVKIEYLGSGLSTTPSTAFLAQGLPALRTLDAVAYSYAALDDYTGERGLQLYSEEAVTDLTAEESAETASSLSDEEEEKETAAVSESDESDASDDSDTSPEDPEKTDEPESESDTDTETDNEISRPDAETGTEAQSVSQEAAAEDADTGIVRQKKYFGDNPGKKFNPSEKGSKTSEGNAETKSVTPNYDNMSFTELTDALQGKIRKAEDAGLHLSFMMLDINSGTILAYNSETPFYSASSAKAHYIVSLADDKPEAISNHADMIRNITINSSNEDYRALQQIYSLKCYDAWLKSSGVNEMVRLDPGGYTFYSAEDLVRLWLQDYLYFEFNENGKTVGELFETPNVSAIRTTVPADTVTRTKAGWIEAVDHSYTVSVDGGIVYEEDHPYILAILSDYPGTVEKLEQYTVILEHIHKLLSEGAETESEADAASETDTE